LTTKDSEYSRFQPWFSVAGFLRCFGSPRTARKEAARRGFIEILAGFDDSITLFDVDGELPYRILGDEFGKPTVLRFDQTTERLLVIRMV
jgi:hypothetical protein